MARIDSCAFDRRAVGDFGAKPRDIAERRKSDLESANCHLRNSSWFPGTLGVSCVLPGVRSVTTISIALGLLITIVGVTSAYLAADVGT